MSDLYLDIILVTAPRIGPLALITRVDNNFRSPDSYIYIVPSSYFSLQLFQNQWLTFYSYSIKVMIGMISIDWP